MAAAAAEQRHASAGLAQDLSSLQPPDLLRTMAADGGLDDIPDPTAMTDSQRARMAEELIQRTLAEPRYIVVNCYSARQNCLTGILVCDSGL